MERSSPEEKVRIQVEFTAMYTNVPLLIKSVIPIKIDSAYALPHNKVHAGYSKLYSGGGK